MTQGVIRLTATLSHPPFAPPIQLATHAGTQARDARIDASARLGLDVDLVLGPIGGDTDELDEYTRLVALVDMCDSGFITAPADLDLVAGIVEDIEGEDDAEGYEDDIEEWFAGGWAA